MHSPLYLKKLKDLENDVLLFQDLEPFFHENPEEKELKRCWTNFVNVMSPEGPFLTVHDARTEESKSRIVAVLNSIATESMLLLFRLRNEPVTVEQIKFEFRRAERLHIDKNAGYAGADNPDTWANFRVCDEFGIGIIDGVIVRMCDKYGRILNLLKDPNNDRVGEKVEDTLFDLSAYALIAQCICAETWNKQNGRTDMQRILGGI